MWNPVVEAIFLAGAGVLGGVAGSSGAIGSLVSYPALLVVGIPALPANVTNAVAVLGSAIGSTISSRPELQGSGRRLLRWSLFTATGAVLGVALLLLTPGGFFQWIVPFLVLSAALLLLGQPRVQSWRETRQYGADGSAGSKPTHLSVLPYGLFAVAVYEGYFGAASGVMTLALLMLTVETQLARANAFKNALLGVADLVAAIGFAIFGPVHWLAALVLGLGFVGGGAIGPHIARRVPASIWRRVIAGAGLCLAGWLFVRAIRG